LSATAPRVPIRGKNQAKTWRFLIAAGAIVQILTAVVSLAPRLRKPWPIARSLPIALAIMTLTACNGLQYRHGPPPIIEGPKVEAASANKLQLLRALAQDASIGGDRASDWYLIAEAGFNFVDDQCRAYFDELFFLDRRADRIKTGLVVADKTTAAILAVTGATMPTMNIVAQAFGFAVHATDLIAGTYLYRLPPATTQGFVVKLQSAYRRGASANRAMIDTPTAAYYAIQRYLDLCLPPRIEAEIAKQIAGTTARAVISDDSIVDLETASIPAPEVGPRVIPPLVRERVIVGSTDPLAKRRPIPDDQKKRVTDLFLQSVQAAICAPQTTGKLDPPTVVAIREYLTARRGPVPSSITLDNKLVRTQLQAATTDVPDCRLAGFLSPFEVATFGPSPGLLNQQTRSDDQKINITNMQRQLQELLRTNAPQVPFMVTGRIDDQTRRAIAALNNNKPEIDAAFNTRLLRVNVPDSPPAPLPPAAPAPGGPNGAQKK
jgi:hypothetical protein